MVSEVSAKLKGAQSVIVAEYRGLDVGRVTQLRSKARKSGLYLRVLKNTLARRAVQGTPFEQLSDQMAGPRRAVGEARDQRSRPADVRHLPGSGRRREGAIGVRQGQRAVRDQGRC